MILSRETCEVASVSVQGQTRGVNADKVGSRHKTMIQEHVSVGGDNNASLGNRGKAVLKLRVDAVANVLGNVVDLCQTSDLATCQMKLSIRSFSIESHRQSSCDQIDLHGTPEEATSTQIGGISTADITREDEEVSPVDVKPSCTWIDKERDSNLQANAAQKSDPGEIQELVVGSEELKMGNPVDLDVDFSPTYQEEHANGILEATAPGTSQPGAWEDMSIISREPGDKLCSKISMAKSEVLVADSQVDCNGLKRCMPIEIVNSSELHVASKEVKMGSPVNLDIDVLSTYQEEQGTDILEATATGESLQVGAGEDPSIISREPGGHQAAKIEIQG